MKLPVQLRTPFNYVLMNMIIAEMGIAMFGTPIEFVAAVMHGWRLGPLMCKISGFALTFGGTVCNKVPFLCN
jgi:hypothetical protein